MAFNADDAGKLKTELREAAEAQSNLDKSAKDLVSSYSTLYTLSRQIKDVETKTEDAIKRRNEITKKLGNLKNNIDERTRKDLEYQKEIYDEIIHQNLLAIKHHKEQLALLRKQKLTLTNIANSIGSSMYSSLKKNWGWYNKMDKAARNTATSMGLTGDHLNQHRKSLNKVATRTADIGVTYEQINKSQAQYSSNIGRAVQLSDAGVEAMGELSVGAMLGAEGAANLAANMDVFGKSVVSTRDTIEETMNLSTKMGVNATKVIEIMTQNLKLANQYNFEDGVKNLTNMAAMTAKFKLDMQSVANMSEKLFEPEGAVEMAANLQVLGGGFAKLADPFKLMFQARNDMEGLQESIIKATSGIADFNEKTGEFHVSAQELHRLRYVAKSTGIELSELVETAKRYAEVDMIKKNISPNIDPEFREFISSTAKWNEDKKGFTMTVVNKEGERVEKLVQNLKNYEVKRMKSEEATLKERSKTLLTLTDKWSNLLTKLGYAFLPIFQSLDETLSEPLQRFIEYLSQKRVVEKLQDFGKQISKFIIDFKDDVMDFIDGAKSIGDVFSNNLLVTGGLIAGAIFSTTKWIGNGVALGIGFNMTAMKNMMGRGGEGPLSHMINPSDYGSEYKSPIDGAKSGKFGKFGKYGRNIGKFGKGAGRVGGVLGLASLIPNLIGNIGNEKLDIGDALLKTVDQNKGMLGGAALGALIGSLGGPIGMGVGMGVGALADMFLPQVGDWGNKGNKFSSSSFAKSSPKKISSVDDFISRPDGLTKINSEDTLIGAKKNGPIDKMVSGNQTPSKLDINFKPLKIEISPIEIKSNNKTLNIDHFENNPKLIRELSRIIQEEIRKAIGGGKLSPSIAK